MGAVAAAGFMHVLAVVMEWLLGAAQPQPFSWRAFTVPWLIGAVVWTLLGWWERRRPTAIPPRWTPGAPRALRAVGAVAEVVWMATAGAAYGTALDGQMSALWAAAATAAAFVPLAVAWHLAERYEPGPQTAVAGEPPM
ncbi:hypothetical protein C8E86_1706 [Catellatospora citrea]|nr:hypothetical protein C8E86_1706 [Catellatospora citrea]